MASHSGRILVMALVCACNGSRTGALATVGTFVLVAVNGSPLPAVTLASAVDTTRVLADTLSLLPSGLASHVSVIATQPNGRPPMERRYEQALMYRVSGDSVWLDVVCTDALCATGMSGVLHAADLEITPDLIGSRGPLFWYERVGAP